MEYSGHLSFDMSDVALNLLKSEVGSLSEEGKLPTPYNPSRDLYKETS